MAGRKRTKLAKLQGKPVREVALARNAQPAVFSRIRSARARIVAYALISGYTWAQAAKHAGLPERTARSLLQRPENSIVLDEALHAIVRPATEHARSRIAAAVPGAVDVLVQIAHEGCDDHARVKAAMALLDRAGLHPRQELRIGPAVDGLETWDDGRLLEAASQAAEILAAHARTGELTSGDHTYNVVKGEGSEGPPEVEIEPGSGPGGEPGSPQPV